VGEFSGARMRFRWGTVIKGEYMIRWRSVLQSMSVTSNSDDRVWHAQRAQGGRVVHVDEFSRPICPKRRVPSEQRRILIGAGSMQDTLLGEND
jgi:hypothetical protein